MATRISSRRELGELVTALFPSPRQFTDFLGLLAREVMRLGAIVGEVVQFPCPVAPGGDELPVSDADCPVSFVLPPKLVVLDSAVTGKGRHEAQARASRAGAACSTGERGVPVSSRIVGTTSMTWPASRRSSPRALIPFGQCTINGVEIPPS